MQLFKIFSSDLLFSFSLFSPPVLLKQNGALNVFTVSLSIYVQIVRLTNVFLMFLTALELSDSWRQTNKLFH